MSTLYIIYIAILVVFVLSLILTIVDWISFRSVSIKISNLEIEIEKKAQEFNNLKKEHASSQLVETQTDKLENSPQEYSTNQEIEIVRNIRGNFENTESHSNSHLQEQFTNTNPSESQPQRNTPNSEPDQPIENNDADILDVVGDNQTQVFAQEPIVFRLYSDTIKDADFAKLWKLTTEVLSTEFAPNLAIDFTGINFIYDKELGYLEKIAEIISHQNGSLVFYNCDNELASLIMKRPILAPLINQNKI